LKNDIKRYRVVPLKFQEKGNRTLGERQEGEYEEAGRIEFA